MSISISCLQCNSQLKAKDSLAGKRIACPKCKSSITVPNADGFVQAEVVSEDPKPEATQGLEFLNLDLTELGGVNYFGGEFRSQPVGQSFPKNSISVQKNAEQPEASHAPRILSQKTLLLIVSVSVGCLLFLVAGGIILSSFLRPNKTVARTESVAPDSVAGSVPSVESTPKTTKPPPYESEELASVEPKTPSKPTPPIKAETEPVDVLDRLKSATVFIKVKTSTGGQSGSGFLLESSGRQGVVVTNSHVITAAKGSVNNITCVFHSGAREEFSVQASVAGNDEASDIAILKIEHENLPACIDTKDNVALRETTPLLALGFPYGETMATNNRNPSISISRCTISSIRRDEFDLPIILQIDGGINQGNSGGPMVTEDGKLVGIAVAKFRGADNIGFAIPKQTLTESIKGRVVGIRNRPTVLDAQGQSYSIQVELMDPSQNIESASVVTFEVAKQIHKAPKADGNWQQVTDEILVVTDLQIQSTTASGKITSPVDDSEWLFQIRIKRKDGSSWFSPPATLKQESSNDGPLAGPNKQSKPKGGATPPAPFTGQLQVISLPDAMADFAMNPRTGEIAAIDPMANTVVLLRESDMSASLQDAPHMTVGTTPISIVYKRFNDMEVYAIVCTQDSHMYLLDTKEFKLLKKIPLTSSGVSSVVVSQNIEDPFVYYCYGSGHDSVAGAVDLRKMAACGIAFDHAMDCAISADGRVAYRRGPWSPSGFESLFLKTSFADSAPKFERLFYDHNSCSQYFPDPHGEFTANGSTIYSKDLRKKVASLNFVPLCFFKEKPIVLGLREKTLRAASYNTFSDIGSPLNLPLDPQSVGAGPVPRGTNSNADFKKVGYKLKLMADEDRARVIVAIGKKLFIIPLSDLQIEDEPLMAFDLSSTELKVGVTERINISPRDPRVTMQLGDLPEGAKVTEKGFEWKPTNQQVGVEKVQVTLSFGDKQRVVEANFKVMQPFIDSPIEIGNFFVDEKAAQLICWSSSGIDEYGRASSVPGESSEPKPRIAVIPLRRGTEAHTLSHADPIKQVVSVGSRLAVLPANDTTRVEIYEVPAMKRLRTLVSAAPLVGISVEKDQLILQSESSTDVYQMSSLKRLRSIDSGRGVVGTNGSKRNASILKDGILSNELLIDPTTNEPILIISPGSIPALGGADARLYSGGFLRRDVNERSNARNDRNNGMTVVAGPTTIPNRSAKVALENDVNTFQPAGSVHTNFTKQSVSLRLSDSSSTLLERIPIVAELIPNSTRPTLPTMQMTNDVVFVALGNRIFRWKIEIPSDHTNGKGELGEFYIVPHQSQIILKSGRNMLKHAIRGGQSPYEFVLLSPVDGLTIDATSGALSVEPNLLMQAALPILSRSAAGANDLNAFLLKLQTAAARPTEYINTQLRLKVNGFPVAVPIHFKAIDNQGQVAEMQYFVIIDIPFQEAKKLLKQKLN